MTNNDLKKDYKYISCQVLSPELPCGSAWLANCFIELNTAVVNKWDLCIENEWIRIAPFHYLYNDVKSWQQVIPSLKNQKEYLFHSDHAISFQHIWPFMSNKNSQTILFIRHPYDALFSFWRRQIYNSNNIGSFKQLMNSKYYHYNFTVKDYLLIYNSILKWHSNNHNCLIIKFEEYKSDAVTTLSTVLDYLGIRKTDKQINSAVKKSDVSQVLAIEKTIEKQGELNYKNHFKGKALEFKESYSQNMIETLSGVFDDFCQWFDYPYPKALNENNHSTSLSEGQIRKISKSITNDNYEFNETLLNIITLLSHQITWKD